ncbi:hypothetical protein FACS189493_6350 [Spirochaetia bacterium]|nr:hypothetical protein FACS189493_6350 [Spirochaetia bacterium]
MVPMGRKRRIILVLLLVLGAALVGTGLVFWLRSPVLVVSDLAFDSLYGLRRIRDKQVELSIKLFRRVKTVRIADSAAADVAVFAVEEAAAKPYSVLFPYRYAEEARRYAGEFPDIPTAILSGRVKNREVPPDSQETQGVSVIETDTRLDLYRVGLCAAALARAAEGETPGNVLFFRDDLVDAEDREAFEQGLAAGDFKGSPVYRSINSSYDLSQNIGCVVMTGPVEEFLKAELELPVILFSWADPAISPHAITLIFDDSPWTQVESAVSLLTRTGGIEKIPSEVIIFNQRILKTENLPIIKGAIHAWLPE